MSSSNVRSEESPMQFLTRREYDEMVDRFPAFMQSAWVRLWKQWSADGVRVYQCKGSGLATRLNQIDSRTPTGWANLDDVKV